MAKDKIDVLLRDWVETQRSRLGNMTKYKIKVKFNDDEYYASLRINKTEIIIQPFDEEIDELSFSQCRLRGSKEIGSTGILLTRRFGKSSLKMFFRTSGNRDQVLKKIRTLIGEESTESSESTESEEASNGDQDANN